jgi:hypothetical protein
VCIATAALIAGSTTSTGALAVLIAKKFRRKQSRRISQHKTKQRRITMAISKVELQYDSTR